MYDHGHECRWFPSNISKRTERTKKRKVTIRIRNEIVFLIKSKNVEKKQNNDCDKDTNGTTIKLSKRPTSEQAKALYQKTFLGI